jgi:hypothetical protein
VFVESFVDMFPCLSTSSATAFWLALSHTLLYPSVSAVPASTPTYMNSKLSVSARVQDLLSQMTFLEQLAQTRNVGGILQSDGTYNHTFVDTFNNGYGGGSICKVKIRNIDIC